MSDSVESKKPAFFAGVKSELKKITWPDKDDMLKQSIAVVCVSIVTGAFIALLDFVIQYGVEFLTTF
ncbi:MAG: preprotein translocase subunit SecE [Lachnospiraceae bacterium]|nr:preprotein translocase subunit SecE [Lachnospiraceae bacterium]MBR4994170.1 preprotein translocase subunit SecE [Lachnospiraceae bacterium]MBR5943389.1 preprotein translocase subunit SecE [Lachnospiraceae bacterium]